MNCPFCVIPKHRIMERQANFFIIRDAYPVTDLHTLIISNEHDFIFDMMSDEQALEFTKMVQSSKTNARQLVPTITGFNIGINEGADAGQTVMHFHCHVIPRRNNDAVDPRGGVRGVIPDKQHH